LLPTEVKEQILQNMSQLEMRQCYHLLASYKVGGINFYSTLVFKQDYRSRCISTVHGTQGPIPI